MREPSYTTKERKRLLKWLDRIEKKATARTDYRDAELQARVWHIEQNLKAILESARAGIEQSKKNI